MAEKRLIDANALYGCLKIEHELTNGLRADVYWRGFNNGLTMAQAAVSQAPTVDAVEVVRCKDCKRFIPYSNECWNHPAVWTTEEGGFNADPDGFCSYGERRTDG